MMLTYIVRVLESRRIHDCEFRATAKPRPNCVGCVVGAGAATL